MYAWVYYAVILIAAVLVARATAPKPPDAAPPVLDDIDAPTAEEGKPIGVLFGTCWLKSPNVVWYGNLRTYPIIKQGGKK
jgi:hypothetical protein